MKEFSVNTKNNKISIHIKEYSAYERLLCYDNSGKNPSYTWEEVKNDGNVDFKVKPLLINYSLL